MKRNTAFGAVLGLLMCLVVAAWGHATPASPTKVLAIFFTADWCGSCKVLKPKLEEVKREFAAQPVLFTQFDLTDDFTREQSARYSELIGLEPLYREYERKERGRTGFVLLVSATDRKPIGQVTANLTVAEIRAQITKALSAPATKKSGFADVNGTKLYYEVAGQGQPVVLLHGGFMDGRMWDAQFEELAKQFTVLRYDIRGAGKSDRNYKDPYSSVEDLEALLRFLEIERAHIVGLSAGGELAINFVLAKPNRALSLIAAEAGLTGLPFQGDGLDFMRKVFATAKEKGGEAAAEMFVDAPVFASMKKSNPSAISQLRVLLRDNSHLFTEGRNDQRPAPPAANRLQEIKVPTLILVSEHEGGYAAQVAEKLMSGVPCASKQTIANSGHMMNMEQPAAFNRAVLEFLKIGAHPARQR